MNLSAQCVGIEQLVTRLHYEASLLTDPVLSRRVRVIADMLHEIAKAMKELE